MRLNTQSPIFLLAILFLSGMSLIYVVSADVVPGSIVAQPPLRRISRESAPSIVAAAFPMFSGRTQVAALEGAGSGLVGWWKFDEGSGTTAADSSGSGNTGTLVGGPTWTTGQIGGALSFNGTNQYVTASTNSMPASAQAVSISAWVFISQYPNSKSSIVWRGSTSAGGGFGDPRIFALTLEGASNNVPVFYAESAGSGGLYYDATSSVSIGTGSWHLITGTSDGSGHLAIYVDGSSAGAQGPFLGFSSGSADSTVYVGADNSRSSLEDYFPGRVDDVRIYNRALSAQEVSVLYAEASSGPLPTPTPTLTPTPTPTPTATPPLQSAYYVDASRTSNGDGSANNPWRLIEDIDWAKVQSSLNSTSVSIYFSSRSTWDNDGSLTVKATGSASAMLTLDGSTYYNSVSSGPAQWVLESTPGNRASFSNSTVTGGSMYINNDTHYVTVRGFSLLHPTWGGINIGQSNPSINIDHIVVDDVSIDSPQNNHGVWGGWLESGVHDITVENSIIKNTPLEGIYIGHYNYLQNSITGVVIRNNILIDVGSPAGGGSASINVKPPDIGAVVSGNAIYRTTTSTGAGCGIFFAADGGQIYDNTIHGITHVNQNVCGGHGIFLTSDGDGVGNGHAITSALIYNNLIYGNDGSAISVSATTNTPGADVTGIRIYNNTLWRNGLSTSRGDIDLSSFSPRSIQVTDVRNNIIGNLSGNPYVKTYNTTAHIVASDDNIYNTSATALWSYGGSNQTWSAWQAQGYDSNGQQNVSPLFDVSGQDFHLLANSPAISHGSNLTSQCASSTYLCTDSSGLPRPASGPWDIGAYQYAGGITPSPTPTPTPTPDLTAPIVSVTAPINSSTISGTVNLSANATDNIGVQTVQFQVDGINLGPALTTPTSGSTYSGSWNTVGVANGMHTITAVASDAAGNTTTALSISVTVNNPIQTPAPTTPPSGGGGGSSGGGGAGGGAINPPSIGIFTPAVPQKPLPATAPKSSASSSRLLKSFQFPTTLKTYTTNVNAKNLQIFLNDHKFTVTQSGPGSIGNETTYYGPATIKALAKFQAANGIVPALGNFGPITRAYVNQLLIGGR